MNYVLNLLEEALKEWKEMLASHKVYYKGEESDKRAIRDFKEANENISQLKKSIKILKK